MSSIINRPNGHKWIQFRGLNGKRQTVRLGVASKAQATEFRHFLDCLVACRAMGQPPDISTAQWLGRLSQDYHERLAAVGLVEGRQVTSLDDALVEFAASVDVKESTKGHLDIIAGNLRLYFGKLRGLAAITAGDAKQFRAWLAAKGGKSGGELASATVSRRCRRSKQIFAFFVQKRWIAENPFGEMEGWCEVNRERDYFVSREETIAIMEQMPTADLRAVLALARFGGLRCPSEVLPMEWDQVDWERATLLVRSPKTGQRTLPLFPEIEAALSALWDAAPKKEPLLFPGLRLLTNAGLTDKLERAARKARIILWPKAWQNCRASREAELLMEYPINRVAGWLGHSPKVALEHYDRIVKELDASAVGVKLRKSVLRLGEIDREGEAKAEAPEPSGMDFVGRLRTVFRGNER